MTDIPRPFRGPRAELDSNIATHDWATWDGETRCATCDCRRYGRVAMWPCGQDERITTATQEDAIAALADLIVGLACASVLSELEEAHNA